VAVLLYACGGRKNPLGNNANKDTTKAPLMVDGMVAELGNKPKCIIFIDGKGFTIPADSIRTGFVRQDSSYSVDFIGIGGSTLSLSIPHLFKCPCKIPAGFTGERYKISFSDEYATHPTVRLNNYPVKGMYVESSSDGRHNIALTEQKENAVEILSVEKISDNPGTNSAEFLIKGRLHTTLLKNLNHQDAGADNKDYGVKGGFVIKDKIYF
jgi:hypothetical protein